MLLTREESLSQEQFNADVRAVLDEVAEILKRKNIRYGNAALEPKPIFSPLDAVARLQARLDEKLARVAQGLDVADDEDTVVDLIGLLVIYQVARKRRDGHETK